MFGLRKRDLTRELPVSADRPRLPYPDGWFAVAFSDEVRPGRVVRRRFKGEDIVVYRTRQGRVRVVNPYCPHLGAHLGFGGRVEGEDLVCPFHHFAFAPDGRCVRTGYGTRPPKASLTQLTAREVNGVVMVWSHARGEAPTWDVPVVPAQEFPPPARHSTILLDHPQEVVENSVYIGHFGPVHGTSGAQVTKPLELNGPRLTLGTTVHRMTPLLGRFDVDFDVEANGLGHIHVVARMPRLGLSALVQIMPTPLDPCRIETRFTVSARLGTAGGRAGRYSSWLATQFFALPSWQGAAQDAPIWQNKTYLRHPRLAQGDGPIMRFRHWAEQFYPDEFRESGEAAVVSDPLPIEKGPHGSA